MKTWIFRIDTTNYQYTSIELRAGRYQYQIQLTRRTLDEAFKCLFAIYGNHAEATLLGTKKRGAANLPGSEVHGYPHNRNIYWKRKKAKENEYIQSARKISKKRPLPRLDK